MKPMWHEDGMETGEEVKVGLGVRVREGSGETPSTKTKYAESGTMKLFSFNASF